MKEATMALYTATVSWTCPVSPPEFIAGKYSRGHRWAFDGGVDIPASASPSVVPLPWSDSAGVDPEEAFVASLSSCHMLTFLWIAAQKKHAVTAYHDIAEGRMSKNSEGRIAVTLVTLRPLVTFAADVLPSRDEIDAMHHQAHDACFIANSVRTEIRCEPR
jgi:organic hydroperoxide reductase OsmC/OhrA